MQIRGRSASGLVQGRDGDPIAGFKLRRGWVRWMRRGGGMRGERRRLWVDGRDVEGRVLDFCWTCKGRGKAEWRYH